MLADGLATDSTDVAIHGSRQGCVKFHDGSTLTGESAVNSRSPEAGTCRASQMVS
ncbi:hypothetical protein OH492_13970 [Vibrio chagasii]|nr:hypothetical protein [Vibrio chagasii]